MNYPAILSMCSALIVSPVCAQSTSPRYVPDGKEIHRYFNHWLGQCNASIPNGCEVLTYTGISKATKKLENTISVIQDSDGNLGLQIGKTDNAVTANIRLSTREEYTVTFMPTAGQHSIAKNDLNLKNLLDTMQLSNSMTLTIDENRHFYSLRGFTKALAFLKARTPLPLARAPAATTYLSEFWSGEWPHGFTMSQDVDMMLRRDHKTATLPTISCIFTKGGTYHHWNRERVEKSKLQFLTIQQTIPYVAQKSIVIEVTDEATRKDQKLSVRKGDEWTFLAYYGEGYFRMKYRGQIFSVGQELAAVSDPRNGEQSRDKDTYQEWLGLPCANNKTGWLLFDEISNRPEFGAPNFEGYGRAPDLKTNSK